MIRRDYILRMVAEFIELLSRLRSLRKDQRWQEAQETADSQFERLLRANAATVSRWSDTELLATVIQGEPTLAVRDKTLMVATLLKEAGEVAIAQGQGERGFALLVKGLHLLLNALGQPDRAEIPGFVPAIESFVLALGDSPLPLPTLGALMQHYERVGEFAKAEDALFAMLERHPGDPALVEFGKAFYLRLRGTSDEQLVAGGLPRSEVEEGLAELLRANKLLR